MILLEQKLSILRNSIKRIALLLCLTMTVSSSTYSQDTSKIIITSEQLKTANLIFAEHKKYSELVPLLQLENSNLEIINKSWANTDSIKTLKINEQNKIIQNQYDNIDRLNKSIKVKNTITISSVVVTILCLLLN